MQITWPGMSHPCKSFSKSILSIFPVFYFPNTNHFICLSELGSHVDTVQSDLDVLKEILKGDGYNLDANTLLEVGIKPGLLFSKLNLIYVLAFQ